MAHWPGDSEYELRRARSNVSISCAHICRLRWPWVSGRPSRGFHKNPALNANHARQTQRRLLGRSLTFPARTASTMRRSLCAYEAAYGDSRLDGAAGGHEANAVDGYGAPRTSCRLTRISNVVRCVNVRKGGSGIRAYAFLSSSTVGDGLGVGLGGFLLLSGADGKLAQPFPEGNELRLDCGKTHDGNRRGASDRDGGLRPSRDPELSGEPFGCLADGPRARSGGECLSVRLDGRTPAVEVGVQIFPSRQ